MEFDSAAGALLRVSTLRGQRGKVNYMTRGVRRGYILYIMLSCAPGYKEARAATRIILFVRFFHHVYSNFTIKKS